MLRHLKSNGIKSYTMQLYKLKVGPLCVCNCSMCEFMENVSQQDTKRAKQSYKARLQATNMEKRRSNT